MQSLLILSGCIYKINASPSMRGDLKNFFWTNLTNRNDAEHIYCLYHWYMLEILQDAPFLPELSTRIYQLINTEY